MPQRFSYFTQEQEDRFIGAHPPSKGYAHSIRLIGASRGVIWQGHSSVFPAILQTEDLARGILGDAYPDAPDEEIERMVGARMERVGALRRAPYEVVLGKRALRGAHVGRPELDLVLRGVRGELPNRDVHILPGRFTKLPTTPSWPKDMGPQEGLIVTYSPEDGVAALTHDGLSVHFGDVAERLGAATHEISAMALGKVAAERLVVNYINQLPAAT
jgi:hypothetical protein